jgi:hypothetical protein
MLRGPPQRADCAKSGEATGFRPPATVTLKNVKTVAVPDGGVLGRFSFLVVGLARNCQASIRQDILRFAASLKSAKEIHWLIVESDSADGTTEELSRIRTELPNFRFVSMGSLRDRLPRRTERIAFCRNLYVKEIRKHPAYQDIDYVVVADLDGLNTHITQKAFESCWAREDWDMCAANQDGPYYDVWALRHPMWSPNDCFAQHRFLNTIHPDPERNLVTSVYSRMIRISPRCAWIAVDSAFGGLAVYRRGMFQTGEYVGINSEGEECCEHVHFHAGLIANGARLYINPMLLNAAHTQHAVELLWHRTVIRGSVSVISRVAPRVLGQPVVDWLRRLIVKSQ